MRALLVYESMFGNTKEIAQAVADGLAAGMSVATVEVGTAPAEPTDIDLLVVGAPTHAFGMSRQSTRESAAAEAEKHGRGLVSTGPGIREWLARLPADTAPAVAAFDTRIRKPRAPGSAARAASRRLRRLGARALVPPMSFYVEGMAGPLSAGERERARRWGETIARTLQPADAA